MSENSFNLDELYKTYGPMVLRRCQSILKDKDIALDIMQNVFLTVARKREQIDMKYPSSFLYRIATNLSLNYIRDNKRLVQEASRGQDDEFLVRVATIESGEKRSAAKLLLDKLFGNTLETTKMIAMLHYRDGFTLEETAQEVGMSVSGVRKRLRNLRSELKQLEEEL